MPRITYTSLTSRNVTFYVRIISPNGQVRRNPAISPEGFTTSWSGRINRGSNQSLALRGWGNAESSTYQAGEYTVEVWHNNERLISERVMIRP